MGVFEKPPGSGIWWVNYHELGKRRREKVGSKKRAVDYLAKAKDRARLRKLFPEEAQAAAERLTVKEMIEKFLPCFSSKRTFATDDKRLARYCIEEFGSIRAKELKPSRIEEYRNRRLAAGTAPATINRCVAFLKRIYNLAIRDDLLRTNPVTKLKMLKEANVLKEDWTPEEEDRVIGELKPHHRRILLVLLLTGMRAGELLGRKIEGKWVGLAWTQVDFRTNIITLHATKNGESREIPMGREVRSLMLEQRAATPEFCKWVFPGQKPIEPLRRDSFYWRLQAACARAGIARKRVHSTRHSFCSKLLMATGDLKTVSELAGHSGVAITAKLYAHVTNRHRHKLLDRLSQYREQERMDAALGGDL